jgi:hypothetical protein
MEIAPLPILETEMKLRKALADSFPMRDGLGSS